MNSAPLPIPVRTARNAAAAAQDTLPSRYRLPVMLLSMLAFTLATVAWLNESWLYLFESPIWLNRYTEYAIILGFGLWRIYAEQNPYTRKRLIILVTVVTGFWWLIPWLSPTFEPYVGYLWSQPVFPALHTPGTLTFFLTLLLVFLFGRRIICGFGCPCVGIRETVGFPFRRFTLRGQWAWRLRHTKWVFFIWYVGVLVATQFPPNAWTTTLVGLFAIVIGLTYFGSFFIIPLTGNRFYCRYLCPYGATFGLLNHAGFYGIDMDRNKCVDCGRCEQACDMGIPVMTQGRSAGKVTGLEDCMGCARCVLSCPTDALEIKDVRNWFRPGLQQNASHLLKRTPVPSPPRQTAGQRPIAERLGDWQDTELPLPLQVLRRQADRCLDCGEPGCRSGCPLGNLIPEWLAAASQGDDKAAGDLVHAHSVLPEVCGSLCPQHRLCEGSCTRGRLDDAVTIGAIERDLAKRAMAAGWRYRQPGRRKGQSVAVIGAGPAGLACAERLNRDGVTVTVYDQAAGIGGLLLSVVPSFKLDKTTLRQRQTLLEAAGIQFRLGVTVDGPLMDQLLADNAGVFLGLGAPLPRIAHLPGETLEGVTEALYWLASLDPEKAANLQGKKILVLGGGDTAMDCARSALRMGAKVTVAYRGLQQRMRAMPKEVLLTQEEGAEFLFSHDPRAIIGNRHARQVVFETPFGNQAVNCDQVIVAFGQKPAPPPWLATRGIAIEPDGRIRVNEQGRTTHPQVWSGGDNTHGPDLAVTAMAAGRRAAEDMLLQFQPVAHLFAVNGINHPKPLPMAALDAGGAV